MEQFAPVIDHHVRGSRRVLGATAIPLFLIALTAMLVVDALIHPIARFDLAVMRAIQAVDFPGLALLLLGIERLTGSHGAVAAWFCFLAGLAIARQWALGLALLLVPIGGLVNAFVGHIVMRTRPDGGEYALVRSLADVDAPSFPSGHAMGAIMLYGLMCAFACRMANRRLRWAVQALAVALIALTGFERIWEGAHWPSDVLAGYALGGLLLVGILRTYRRLDVARVRALRILLEVRRVGGEDPIGAPDR